MFLNKSYGLSICSGGSVKENIEKIEARKCMHGIRSFTFRDVYEQLWYLKYSSGEKGHVRIVRKECDY